MLIGTIWLVSMVINVSKDMECCYYIWMIFFMGVGRAKAERKSGVLVQCFQRAGAVGSSKVPKVVGYQGVLLQMEEGIICNM